MKTSNLPKFNWLFFLILTLGIAARLFAATLGHDYDFDSWWLIAQLFDDGKNIYASTDRYNFAPGWFFILHFLDLLSGHNENIFRYLVAGILSLGDVGIFVILWRRFGKLAGCWFLLNPISIIVSGYQNNFDTLAIFLGLIAALTMGDDFEQPVNRRKFFGLVLFGFSLIVKHVFFAFPFWLAVKQKGLSQKLIVILVPVLMFALSFAPYLNAGGQGIVQNVFQYRAVNTAFFYHMFLPPFLQFAFSSTGVWFFLLILFAFICRQKNTVEFLLFYTCVLVAAAPASVNEYLAIPGAFVATHLNLWMILFTGAGTAHLLVAPNGPFGTPAFTVKGAGAAYFPSMTWLHNLFGSTFGDIAIYFLCLGLIWIMWRKNLIDVFRKILAWCNSEIKNQLR